MLCLSHGLYDLIKQTGRSPDRVAPCCVGACVVQVVDALSRHFVSFEGDARVMPLIWHISLLVFVQRYKHQLTTADRDALAHLTTVQHHYKVGLSVVKTCMLPLPQSESGSSDGQKASQHAHRQSTCCAVRPAGVAGGAA